jgi:thioesterase domain-containing protein
VLTVLYPIRPYFGRTVLFVAEEDTRASATGWRTVLRGDLAIRAVGGMHSAMLREPNVAVLAAALEEELAAAKLISE